MSYAIAEDSVSTYAHEPKRKYVVQEALRERVPGDLDRHCSFSCLWIARPERDRLTIVRGEPAIGDRDPARVSREIPNDLLRSREGPADIDVPVLLPRGPAQHGVREGFRLARLVVADECLELAQELALEYGRENFERNEEPPAMHPSVWPESSSGYEAVEVRVVLHSLSPGMEYGKDSDLYASSRRGLQQRLRNGGEECIQRQTTPGRVGMSVKERPEASRDGEDDVEVRYRQQMSDLRFCPQCLIESSASRTVPIPTRVIRVPLTSAAVAHGGVTAEATGTTVEYVRRGTSLLVVEEQITDMIPKDVGYGQRGACAARHATSSVSSVTRPASCPSVHRADF